MREPYTPFDRRYRFLRLLVPRGERVVVRSNMDDAMLWFDGPHRSVPVRLGDVIEFSASNEPLHVLGLRARRTRRAGSK